MKKIILILSVFALFSCNNKVNYETKTNGYNIITIDSCEYIEISFLKGSSSGYYSLTHKGNCKHCKIK